MREGKSVLTCRSGNPANVAVSWAAMFVVYEFYWNGRGIDVSNRRGVARRVSSLEAFAKCAKRPSVRPCFTSVEFGHSELRRKGRTDGAIA